MTIVLGLTGSIGMGKSTVSAMFRRLRVPVFDADAEVRRLQGPGGTLLPAIEALHPGSTNAAGVDRGRLAQAVFGDRAALARLERVIHPAVDRARRRFLRCYAGRPLVVLDVPLLLEKGGWRRVDRIGVVSAPAWRQRARVMARSGMTFERLARIQALQMPDSQKRRRADFVIPTGGTIAATREAVRAIVACLAAEARR